MLALLLLSRAAFAHHSAAEYDRSVLRELEGELVEVHWRNPHVTFKSREVNEVGSAVDWELSGLPLALLENAGLAESLFCRWCARQSGRMGVPEALFHAGEQSSLAEWGRSVILPDSRLRWSDNPAGGQWARESVSGDRRGLYRIWNVADLGAYIARGFTIPA